jgi:hypothetical protein
VYAQIVIDCQTQNNYVSCEYCIGKKSCRLRLELQEITEYDNANSMLTVPLLLARILELRLNYASKFH